MKNLMVMPKKYFFDKNGDPLAFGKIYTYQAGTVINQATYTSEAGDVANTNPIILNSEGYADIFLDGSYDFLVTDADDAEIWTAGPISSNVNEEWKDCTEAFYVSPTSFKMTGNLTSIFDVDRRVRIDNDVPTLEYSSILSSIYAAGETTVTILDSVVAVGIIEACASIVGIEATNSNIARKVVSTDGTTVLDGGTDGTDATFIGDVTGDLAGNVTGNLTGDVAGNADTATDATHATDSDNADNVVVSAADTTPAPLESKIISGSGVAVKKIGTGANEQLQLSSSGRITQKVRDENNTYNSSAVALPGDDTIPQITEGTEGLSLVITPLDKDSTLNIEGILQIAVAAGGTAYVALALFRNSEPDALISAISSPGVSTSVDGCPFGYSSKASISLVDGVNPYWSVSGANSEYFYDRPLASRIPSEPTAVYADGVELIPGVIGSLAVGEYAWGDNDGLGYVTLYVKLAIGDPDSQVAGYVEYLGETTYSVRYGCEGGNTAAINGASGRIHGGVLTSWMEATELPI